MHSEHELDRTRRVKAIHIQIWKELRLWSENSLEEKTNLYRTLWSKRKGRETLREIACVVVFVKMGVIPICIYSRVWFCYLEVDPGRQTCWVILSRGLFNVRLGLWVLWCCGSMTWLRNWAAHFSVFAVFNFSVADGGLPRFLNAVKFQSFCNHLFIL